MLLHDYVTMENAIGAYLPRSSVGWARFIPARTRTWLYRLAVERGYLDACLTDFLVSPFVRVFQFCDWLEWKWTNFLSGGESRESGVSKETAPDTFEGLL